MRQKIVVAALRGLSMGSKFLLFIYLSKVLSISDYGIINIISTSVTFFMFIVGFDFYSYSHREILSNTKRQKSFLTNQFWFHLLGYIIIIPILFIAFLQGFIPIEYGIVFYFILIFEHLSQEAFRLFNLFNKFNNANISLFIRTAGWIGPMYIMYFSGWLDALSLEIILLFWSLGSLASCIYCLGYLIVNKKLYLFKRETFKLDTQWIKQGIKVSAPFFIGTIAYKAIEYSDRYIIDYFLGKESVGIYSFYVNFANIINVAVSTLTITLLIPNLLRAISSKNKDTIKYRINEFRKDLIYTTITMIILVCLVIYPVLSWVQKIAIYENYPIFFITVLGNGFLNGSLYYHYLLYGFKMDYKILYPILITSFINILLNLFFIKTYGIYAAAFSTVLSYALLLILKRRNWKGLKLTL